MFPARKQVRMKITTLKSLEKPIGKLWYRTSTWFCLSTLCVLSVLTVNIVRKGPAPLRHIDEGAWIYSGYIYHLAFEKCDLQSPDWKHRDCLDHPPVAKYLFGAVAASDGYIVDSLKLKEWWFDSVFHLEARAMKEMMRDEIPQSTLYWGRLVCTALFAASCIVLFWIGTSVLAPWTAALAAIIMAACPIVLYRSALIYSGAPFCLLLLLLVRAQIGWLKHCGRGVRWIGWRAICIGLLSAFLVNTKINGLVILPCVTGVIAAGLLVRRKRAPSGDAPTIRRLLADVLVSAALVMATFLIAAIAMNPSLHCEPIEFVKAMFEHRWKALEFQMTAHYIHSLPTWPLMASGVVRGLFFANDWLFEWWCIPGLLFFFLIGVGGLPATFAHNRHATLVILINGAMWGGTTAYTYQMDWNRYLLPCVPFVMLLTAAGVTQSLRMLRDLGRPARRLGWVVFAVVATAGLSWIQSHWTMENHLDPDKRQLVDATRQAIRLRPDRARGYIRYAEMLFLAQHEVDESERMCRLGLNLNPNHAKGHRILGEILISENRLTEGLNHLRSSLEINPYNAAACASAADTLLKLDRLDAQAGQLPATTARLDEAVRLYFNSVRLSPNQPRTLTRLALILAVHPDPKSRKSQEAIVLARKAVAIAQGDNPAVLTALAVACASAGQFDQAIAATDKALTRLEGTDANSEVVKRLRKHRERFKRRQPSLPPTHYRHLTIGK